MSWLLVHTSYLLTLLQQATGSFQLFDVPCRIGARPATDVLRGHTLRAHYRWMHMSWLLPAPFILMLVLFRKPVPARPVCCAAPGRSNRLRRWALRYTRRAQMGATNTLQTGMEDVAYRITGTGCLSVCQYGFRKAVPRNCVCCTFLSA